MPPTDARPHRGWASRWTFILAAAGSAIGLGNIWKFPYITGLYGGGAFVLVYLACILLVGIPVMMAEVLLGRQARRNPVSAMGFLTAESAAPRAWALIGWMGILAGLLILSFYSVIAGWTLDYIGRLGSGSLNGASAEAVQAAFDVLQASPQQKLAWHTVFILMTVAIVAGGVSKGLGLASRILMPLLFLLLLVLLGYSLATGDFAAGFHFLFDFDAGKLSGKAVLAAMGHSFFTLSLGMGAILVYGSYMPAKASIGRTVLVIALLDTAVALVAGLAIFPLVFANGLQPGSGPGLMFVTLPIAFASMPGGDLFGALFFVLVAIAAWTSAISLIEPGVAWLNETWRVKRPRAALLLGGIGWLGGIACIHSGRVFDALDFVASNLMLPLGGLLIALFAGWQLRPDILRQQLADMPETTFRGWRVIIRYIAPAGVVLVFLHSLGMFG